VRILHVNDLATPGAGAEHHVRDLVLDQRAAGHDVEVFAARPPLPAGRALRTWWDRAAAAALRRVLAGLAPDVVHFHNLALLSPSVLEAAASVTARRVATLHDFRYELDQTIPGQRRPRGPAALAKAILDPLKVLHVRRLLDACCHVLIGPSDAVAGRASHWTRHASVVSIRYPVAARPCPRPPAPGSPLLFLGRLVPEKGLLTLCRALDLTGSAVTLRVAGSGPLAAELAGRRGVHLLGHLTPGQIELELERCAAVVAPSEWLENSPFAVLQAQAAGRAAVATQVGGLPELVRHESTGLLVPPFAAPALAAALVRMATEPGLAAGLGAAAHARVVREHDPDRCRRELMHAYGQPVAPVRDHERGARAPAQHACEDLRR
jgi:glycosyltransferase involved in cell wall biosynthesis